MERQFDRGLREIHVRQSTRQQPRRGMGPRQLRPLTYHTPRRHPANALGIAGCAAPRPDGRTRSGRGIAPPDSGCSGSACRRSCAAPGAAAPSARCRNPRSASCTNGPGRSLRLPRQGKGLIPHSSRDPRAALRPDRPSGSRLGRRRSSPRLLRRAAALDQRLGSHRSVRRYLPPRPASHIPVRIPSANAAPVAHSCISVRAAATAAWVPI